MLSICCERDEGHDVAMILFKAWCDAPQLPVRNPRHLEAICTGVRSVGGPNMAALTVDLHDEGAPALVPVQQASRIPGDENVARSIHLGQICRSTGEGLAHNLKHTDRDYVNIEGVRRCEAFKR